MRLEESAPSGLTLPSDFFNQPNLVPKNASTSGSNAKALDLVAGAAQQSTSLALVTGAATAGMAQFLSPKLNAATYATQTAAAGFALSISGATGNNPRIGVFLANGSTGSVRTGLSGIVTCGANRSKTAGTEWTCYSASLSLAGFTATAGDCIAVEVYADVTFGQTVTETLYTSGTTPISVDVLSTTDAQSFITFPLTLSFVQPPWQQLIDPVSQVPAEFRVPDRVVRY